MQTPEPSNRPLTPSEKAKQDRDRAKAENATADAVAMEKHKNFRAPAGSESVSDVFTPPKQDKGEGIAAYAARVRKAREEFNKKKGQVNAIKVGNEKK